MENIDIAEAKTALQQILLKPDARRAALDALLKVRNRIELAKLNAILGAPLKTMWETPAEDRAFVARVAGAFRVEAVVPQLNAVLKDASTPPGADAYRSPRDRLRSRTGKGSWFQVFDTVPPDRPRASLELGSETAGKGRN